MVNSACPAGTYCDPAKGCVKGAACSSNDQCQQLLGSDPCKTNIACDQAVAQCTFELLDKDEDGHPPVVCGGGDCDDTDPDRAPGKAEVCDGKDNDCNTEPDDGAPCPELQKCLMGSCECAPANTCGAQCVDKQTSNEHCGVCDNACLGGAVCSDGQCTCPSNTTACPGGCIDTKTDPNNCGSCGSQCASGYDCVGGFCTCSKTSCGGVCVDTSTSLQHCGSCNNACGSNQTCQNGTCVCTGGALPCNGVCVDYQTNNSHCGTCNNACTGGKTCQAGVCKCPAPLTDCGTCVDTSSNPAHCGGCNLVCSHSCVGGSCVTCSAADLLLLVDASGSMTETLTSGQTRWEATRIATKNFVNASQSASIGAGIQFLPMPGDPIPCTTIDDCNFLGDPFVQCTAGVCVSFLFPTTMSCDVADYADPAVAIGPLSSSTQRSAIGSAIDGKTPNDGTPMVVALQGALSYAKTRSQASGNRTALVMITDGTPNSCPNTATTAEAAAVAAQYASGSPPIRTYVIGVGTVGATDWTPTDWNQIAASGNTSQFYQGKSQSEIETSLSTIRNAFSACP